MERITERIVTGFYAPGSRLPSVRELAFEAAVNPNTMQRALSALESGGLIYSERTSGRFVTDSGAQIERAREQLAEENAAVFFAAMAKLGYTGEEALQIASQMKEVNE